MILRPQDIYQAWAPPGARWSRWAKPVLFAHLPTEWSESVESAMKLPAIAVAPPADGRTVLVVDLPAARSVATGLALARLGYRPVPLFNALPGPMEPAMRVDVTELGVRQRAARAAVELRPAMRWLWNGAQLLRAMRLPEAAPPAFLLDADRRIGPPGVLEAGDFDNRSVSFPSDFPSAALLRSEAFESVLLVQAEDGLEPQTDLAHTLRRWQAAGLAMLRCGAVELESTAGSGIGRRYTVGRPSGFGLLWARLLMGFGLRRSPLGGFGGYLPDPSSSG